ncbi:MAG: hypothetical protein QOG23_4737 [Blastocatellia bacterium]|jgi:flavin reductase (DIM6/NTAB) family NADH-FMN oxidoreductase RutF|nr:hypothetical protein [Blastocatellia bacterium]
MKTFKKRDYPLSEIRRHLEPGPIVLVSSGWKGEANIMTMGWHMMMEFTPALFGCYIWDGNHSFEMIRRSKECVINIPTTDLVNEVVGIGNCDVFRSRGSNRLSQGRRSLPKEVVALPP